MDKEFSPVIGKDVIESLTIGMYEDSRFIFREYIQNSADQIDKATKDGLILPNQGEIHINIDTEKRTITIEDNATGISKNQVQPILQNIAQSTKQRGIDKGFRGIGRLGGLAYCNKLIFETTFSGENTKSKLIWDAAHLKDIINNRKEKEEAISVIQKVTEFESEYEDLEKHYFKVVLEGVTNDELLNKEKIETYLSLVAPLPFPTKFIFKEIIYNELKKNNFHLDEYKIYLNTEQIFKDYSTIIYKMEGNNKKKEDEIIDIVFFKDYSNDGNLLYWGWHSISGKNQSINPTNENRGLRLRQANIQIGNEYTLLKLHRDKRFQFYFFGEVHGVNPELIPNSRRDYFIENNTFFDFEKKLTTYFHTQIHKFCYIASEINTSVKKIEELKNFEEEFKKKEKEGFIDKKEHNEYKDKLEQKKENAIKAENKLDKIEQDSKKNSTIPIQKILEKVKPIKTIQIDKSIQESESENEKTIYRTNKLSSLTKEERKFLSNIFAIIKDVLDKETAENLIQKIEEKYK